MLGQAINYYNNALFELISNDSTLVASYCGVMKYLNGRFQLNENCQPRIAQVLHWPTGKSLHPWYNADSFTLATSKDANVKTVEMINKSAIEGTSYIFFNMYAIRSTTAMISL